MTSDAAHWTLDGRPIRLDASWSADVTARGGFRSFTGRAEATHAARLAEQEAELVGYRADGSLLWGGRLVLDPVIVDGLVELAAEGPVAELAEREEPLFWQTRDTEKFVLADSDPHEYPLNEKFEVDAIRGQLRYFVPGNALNTTQQAGLVLWVEGDLITGIKWKLRKSHDLANTDLEIYKGTGPSGALTNVANKSLAAGAPDGTVQSQMTGINTDLIRVSIEAQSNHTPAQKTKIYLTNVIVYGRATTDAYSAGAVLGDVLTNAGFEAEVAASSRSLMPLWWEEGSHVDLVDLAAAVEEFWWGIFDRADSGAWIARAGPYAEEVHVALARSIQAGGLAPQRRYNRVAIPFTNTAGQEKIATADADPNPFPGRLVVAGADVHGIELPDRRVDATEAEAVAQGIAAYYASDRRTGSVKIAGATVATGRTLSPYELTPTMLASIDDYDPTIPPQRIVAVKYSGDGTADVDLTQELSASRLLELVSRQARRRGKKAKRRR